jgi:hypothetical protein
MDEDSYNKVISALISIQDPKTPNTTRSECTAYLEEFKKDAGCAEYMIYILNTEHPHHTEMVRYFCLKLFEDWVTLRWNHCDADEHKAIKDFTVQLLQNTQLYDSLSAMRTR